MLESTAFLEREERVFRKRSKSMNATLRQDLEVKMSDASVAEWV
jgi:hypothetical protein